MFVYIIRDISDNLIGWTENKGYVNTFLKDRKYYVPMYTEKVLYSKLEQTTFFIIHDQEELIKFKGYILKYSEYKEVIDIIYYSQFELVDKLKDVKEFIKLFKLKKRHKSIIDKAIKILEDYIIAANFINIIKVKPFIKEYIKIKRKYQ